MSPLAWAGFAVAGAVGATLRYVVDGAVRVRRQETFPFGVLVVNATGTLILGFVSGLVLHHAFPRTPRLILGTGFCGAYTTFSTFAHDTVEMVEAGAGGRALANALATVLVTTAAGAAGLALASL